MVRSKLRTVVAVAAACAAWSGGATAEAQGWLSDRSTIAGPGFRVGNLVIHPGLGIEAGYDTNLFRQSENVRASGILRVTAHAFLETLRPSQTQDGVADGATSDGNGRRVYFRFGGAASYNNFFIDNARDDVAVDGDFLLTFNPDGRYQLTLENNYNRTVRPFTDAPDESTAARFARHTNVARIEGVFASPGRVFQGTVNYRLIADLFEDQLFDYANSLTHVPSLQFSYRFLPRTAVIASTEAQYRTYPNGDLAPTQLPSGVVLRSRAGLNGALTSTVSFAVTAGYTAGFYDSLDDFDNANVRAEVRWTPRQSLGFTTGYERSFQPSFLGNYVRQDAIYASARILAFGSFLSNLTARVSFEETGLALAADGTALGTQERREDIRFLLSWYAEYRFTNWLALTAAANLRVDSTDFEFLDSGTAVTFPDPGGGYVAFDVFGGLRVFY